MIADFIEANGLKARVLSFPSDSSVAHALKVARLGEGAAAQAAPFVDGKMDFFVVLAAAGEKISIGDADGLFGVSLAAADEEEVLKFTGFEKKFFPPIAVFGAKIAFHSSLLRAKTLLFCLNLREYLVIPREEIEESAKINEPLI